MAEKKSGGFKTFLLIVIVIALAVVLGIGAFLILSPTSQIFGMCYVSNVETITKNRVDDATTGHLDLDNYSTINIQIIGDGTTNVHINYGLDGIAHSTVVLKECSRGFMHVPENESSKKYTFSMTSSGSELNILVKEPKYDVVQITRQSVLNFNIHKNYDTNIGNTIFNISNGNGQIVVGGKVGYEDGNYSMTLGSVNAETSNGSILIPETTKITNDLSCKSNKGSITIKNDISCNKVYLESTTGKISTQKIAVTSADADAVKIKSYNSNMSFGDISGNVGVEMESGVLHFANITGDLIAENKFLYTSVYANIITGNVVLVHDAGFLVNIKKIGGYCDITAGNKSVYIGEITGICNITTVKGSIDVTKSKGSTSSFTLISDSGTIIGRFDNVQGENVLKSNNGTIKVYFDSNSSFSVTTNTQNRVHRVWLNDNNSPNMFNIEGTEGAMISSTIDITSNTGGIYLYKIYVENETNN